MMPHTDISNRLEAWFRKRHIPSDHWTGLIAYNQPWFRPHLPSPIPAFPLPDDPCVADWIRYGSEATQDSWPAMLQRIYPAFRFPVSTGIAATPAYRSAVKKGIGSSETPLHFNAPDTLHLEIASSLAGRIPVLTVPDRQDFENILRVLLHRNEPHPIPASMGAALISGLQNMDRIHRLREAFVKSQPDARPGTWLREWESIRKDRKGDYQDRLMLVSVGPYSGVQAENIAMPTSQWLDHSRTIRIHHECTHAFCKRVFGRMHNNLLDELIADFMGLRAAMGSFPADLFLTAMGVNLDGSMLPQGRMINYLHEPTLPGPLWASQAKILCDAALTVQSWQDTLDSEQDALTPHSTWMLCLANSSLLELATGQRPVHP